MLSQYFRTEIFEDFKIIFFRASYPWDLLQFNFPLIVTYKVNGTNYQIPYYAVFPSILSPSLPLTSKYNRMAPCSRTTPPSPQITFFPEPTVLTCTWNVLNFLFLCSKFYALMRWKWRTFLGRIVTSDFPHFTSTLFRCTFTHRYLNYHISKILLAVFRRVRKIAKKRLLVSSRPSFCPHGTTRLPLDGF
jgi:hypothetical protein